MHAFRSCTIQHNCAIVTSKVLTGGVDANALRAWRLVLRGISKADVIATLIGYG
jgi:transcription termination factor Rho